MDEKHKELARLNNLAFAEGSEDATLNEVDTLATWLDDDREGYFAAMMLYETAVTNTVGCRTCEVDVGQRCKRTGDTRATFTHGSRDLDYGHKTGVYRESFLLKMKEGDRNV